MANPRDEFSKSVIKVLQERVAGLCSNPDCQCPTTGPHFSADKATRIGVAAHITAAAQNGPRFDSDLTSEQRSSILNGIWLCQNCAKLVDSDPFTYTKAFLLSWKEYAEGFARANLQGYKPAALQPEAAPPEGWGCPHCDHVVKNGLSICRGCRSELVYGSTRTEREEAAKLGFLTGAGTSSAILYAVPVWLKSAYSWDISPGLGLGLYSLSVVLACGLVLSTVIVRNLEKKHRRSPPRFFRPTVT